MSYILVLIIMAVVIRWQTIYFKYKKSQYGEVSGNSVLQLLFNKGNYGEFLTFTFLEELPGINKLLTNLYIPKEDGATTEIDLLMINRTGVYVFESKNYSGWIFGDEKSKNWMQTLENGQKNKFFNPIWQNKGHISALKKLLSEVNSDHFYSYIVFSERCELKKISVNSPTIRVLKRNKLLSTIKKDISERLEVFNNSQVINLYETLKNFSLADKAIKDQHIKNIKSKSEPKDYPVLLKNKF